MTLKYENHRGEKLGNKILASGQKMSIVPDTENLPRSLKQPRRAGHLSQV